MFDLCVIWKYGVIFVHAREFIQIEQNWVSSNIKESFDNTKLLYFHKTLEKAK